MSEPQDLRSIVDELIGVVHELAGETNRLLEHLERETVAMPRGTQVPLIQSRLSDLHRRVRKLSGTVTPA